MKYIELKADWPNGPDQLYLKGQRLGLEKDEDAAELIEKGIAVAIDEPPKTVKEAATKAEAEELKKKFEAAGAQIELK